MDFGLSQELEMLRQSAREFAATRVGPLVERMEEDGKFPLELIPALGEEGYLGLTVPQNYDGLGMGYLARALVLEEIARVSCALAMALQVFHLGIEPILTYGSEGQKAALLPPLARGERLATVAVTESGGGSDPTAAQTRARREGDEWVLDGRKVFITNSHVADLFTVLARTGDDPPRFTAFLVEKDFPGFRPGREEHKVGMRGCNTGEIILDGCRVPADHVLGKEGDGLKVALSAISEVGRSGMAACALGVLGAALEAATEYSRKRVLYGQPIARLEGIQWKLAQMSCDLEAARLLTYRACWLKDQGKRCDVEMAQAKLFATEAAIRGAKEAVDVFGGYGCMMEYPVQRYYRDAILLGPSAGTSDIMRVVIARALTR